MRGTGIADRLPAPGEGAATVTSRRGWTGVTAVVLWAPVVAYFWFVAHYGVNVVWRDQWSDIDLIGHWHAGSLTLATLWAPHNENRLFFPNLLVLLLDPTTHLNLFVEMYLSAILLVVATALVILTHRRRSPQTPWLVYLPVAVVMFSFVQFEDTLSGFQVCWYMVLAALAGALFVLDRVRLSRVALVGAIVLGVVGSFSAFQGLLIWPVGLILLYHRRRPPSFVAAWVGSAVVTSIVFFYHLDVNAYGGTNGSISASLTHPVVAIKFFFLALGDVTGARLPVPNPWGGPYASRSVSTATILLGIAIFVVAVSVTVRYGIKRDPVGPRPLGVAVAAFGILFALSISVQHAYALGAWYAGTSRYTTFDLLVIAGTYLALVDRRPSWTRGHAPVPAALVPASVAVIIVLQFIFGLSGGLVGGQQTHRTGLETEDVILNVTQATNSVVDRIYFGPSVPLVRHLAAVAKHLRLTFLDSTHPDKGLDVGFWAGTTTSPVRPWHGLHDGETVTFHAPRYAQEPGRNIIVTECNAKVLSGDPHACRVGSPVSVTSQAADGISGRYTVTTGQVGDGGCGQRQACYIEAWSPKDPNLQSLAEVTFAG